MSEKVQDAQTSLRLSRATRTELDRIAAAERRSVANVLRILIDDGIERWSAQSGGHVGSRAA